MNLRSGGTQAPAIAVGVAVLLGGLAACGDPVTGPHDWKVTASLSSQSGVSSGNIGYAARNLRGPLLDGRGAPAAGTSFSEQCTVYASGFTTPATCLVIVNTGTKVYVAKGARSSGQSSFGTFKMLDGDGTLTVIGIPTLSQGPIEQLLIEARN